MFHPQDEGNNNEKNKDEKGIWTTKHLAPTLSMNRGRLEPFDR